MKEYEVPAYQLPELPPNRHYGDTPHHKARSEFWRITRKVAPDLYPPTRELVPLMGKGRERL